MSNNKEMYKDARKIIRGHLENLPLGLGQKVLIPTIKFALSLTRWRNYFPWPMRIQFYLNLFKLVFLPSSNKKRLLGIWDFHACPWSVGDPLIFIETLNCLCLKHQIEEVDICVVYDHDNPAGIRHERYLTPENARDYILNWLPLFSTCQNLSSVFQFKSRSEFSSFIKTNADRYVFFPSLADHLGETYNFWGGAEFKDIFDFYKNNSYIPHLRIGDLETSWAYDFFFRHIKPGIVPVALSLKSTVHSQERNADPNCWLPFIDRCASSFKDVTFVFVGLRGEEPPGIRQRSNVVIAKDYGTTIMEDLALMQKAFMHVATITGATSITMFSDSPYIFFQMPSFAMKKYGLVSGKNFNFATEHQRLFDDTFHMTTDFIFEEFSKLYKELNKEKWFTQAREKASLVSHHPTTEILKS